MTAVEAARRRPPGCLVYASGFGVGLLLTGLQLRLLHATWAHCEVGGPVADDFPGGAQYTWLPEDLARIVIYGAVFVAGLALARGRMPGGTAVEVLTGLVLCAVPFAADYTWGAGMDPGTYLPQICPGGHPSWWPF